jgi:hypothetical protein
MLRDRARLCSLGQTYELVIQEGEEEEACLPVVLCRRVAQLWSYRMSREHRAAATPSLFVQICLLDRRRLPVYGAVAPEDEEREECHAEQGQ